jgi:hypothetical protein
MGLLKHLLFWPVTGPEFLVRYSMEKVQGMVKEELTDDQAIKEDLLALQMQLELGEIDDDEYVEREAVLMQRLREVREWREHYGMGTGGGPVRVARPDAEETLGDEPPGAEEEPTPGEEHPRGGIASSEGATVEFNLDWDEE